MTFVGKILVIVIMVFSLLFLAFSTVVFTTEKNWKVESEKISKQLSDANAKLASSTAELDLAVGNLKAEKQGAEQQKKTLDDQIVALQRDIEFRQQEITKQRTAVETAQENVRSAQADAEARYNETTKIREDLRLVQNQANEFKIQQTQLNQEIFDLQRQLEAAKTNNSQLRETVGLYARVIRENGLDPNPNRYSALEIPPDVDGEITRVDPQNSRFEISLGADDGMQVGLELTVYRFEPQPDFLGKVRVQSVDSDQSVVTLVGSTPQGKRIKEGDIVSTQIRTRN